ncbi:OsmC family protein [Brevibacterium jeotgali]|uniref:Uncharacterized OsmC-related protein n=1 Tax=Brevibacterium jeotgali TaxID=1262550 RepID=A0A2H1L2S4_9MICO|nr:OsmC family protein [Brevibacterium jeotgali]TWC02412.1 putative OsmC-like protein [Brevibacterium jeotgali]SMY11204.1 Uncharacterized OsmC-related protein [Brevibacterium jeotgali]
MSTSTPSVTSSGDTSAGSSAAASESAPAASSAGRPVNRRFREAPSPAQAKTLRAAGIGTGSQQTEVRVRDFTFVSDEPESIGGRDQGPTPMEYLAGAVNSCITVVIDQLAERRALPVFDVQTYTLAKQDTRGLGGSADVQPYFYSSRLQIVVTTEQRDEVELIGFAANAEHICPAINLLRDAHTGLEVVWSFTAEASDRAAEALSNSAWGYPTQGVTEPRPFLTVVNADGAGVRA